MTKYRRLALLAGTAALATVSVTQANAGAFAVREQSVYGQGASFAGIAAGGALSSMFWNPSTITQQRGLNIEADLSAIIPSVHHSFTTATLGALGVPSGTTGRGAVVPASYSSWQVSDRLWVGLSINAPFGLGVTFPRNWAGSAYAQDSKVVSYNFAPTVAYKITDWLSVGAGLQVQYMKVDYDAFLGLGTAANVSGNGWAWGFTAGATITPLPGTVIGIGYRSALNQDIDGTLSVPAGIPLSTPGSVNVKLKLPDTVTLGVRQRISENFTLLAGVEWSNWSRIGTASLLTGAGTPATIGGAAVTFPFNYSDGWFYSLGFEYMASAALTLRAGIGFEKSPITDQVRTPRLPDNDRVWYSVGSSYKLPYFTGATVDLAYSYLDVKNAPSNISAASGNPWFTGTTYIGTANAQIHIFSLALRYQFGAPPVKTALITK